MKRKPFFWLGAVVAVVVGASFVLRERGIAQEADAALEEVERQRRAAQDELKGWSARALEAEQENKAMVTILEAYKADAPRVSVKPSVPAETEESQSYEKLLETNPQFQVRHLAMERSRIRKTHGAFFQQAKLTAEQVARYEEIDMKRQERAMDLEAIKSQKPLAKDDEVIKSMERDNAREAEQALRELLGDDGYRNLKEYNRTSWLREMMVGWAGGAAVVLREPFSAEQGERLIQVMAQASENYRAGWMVKATGADYWKAVESEARKILSPTQLAFFTTMEAPGPVGGRFQTEFYGSVQKANNTETDTKGKKPGG